MWTELAWLWGVWAVVCIAGGWRWLVRTDGKRELELSARVVHAHVTEEERAEKVRRLSERALGRADALPSAAHLPTRTKEEPFVSPAFHVMATEALEVALITPLFLFRFFTLIMSLVVSLVLLRIADIGLPRVDRPAPGERAWWRRWLRAGVNYCGRAFTWALGYWWVDERGQVASWKEAPVMVANHVSLVEAVYVTLKNGGSAVSKDGNFHIPLFGHVLYAMECVYLARDDPNSRIVVSSEIKRRAQSGGKWPTVMIFPEGTCTHGSTLMTFQKGAFLPGVPVQPVAVWYEAPRGRLHPGLLETAPSTMELVVRLMLQWSNRMAVHFMPVYHPSREEQDNPSLFAENVRDLIGREVVRLRHRLDRAPPPAGASLPVTPHGYTDVVLGVRCHADVPHLPPQVAIVESGSLQDHLPSLSSNFLVRIAQSYWRLLGRPGASDTIGLTLPAFAGVLGDPVRAAVLAAASSRGPAAGGPRGEAALVSALDQLHGQGAFSRLTLLRARVAVAAFHAFAPHYDAYAAEPWHAAAAAGAATAADARSPGQLERKMDLREFAVFSAVARGLGRDGDRERLDLCLLGVAHPDSGLVHAADLLALLLPAADVDAVLLASSATVAAPAADPPASLTLLLGPDHVHRFLQSLAASGKALPASKVIDFLHTAPAAHVRFVHSIFGAD